MHAVAALVVVELLIRWVRLPRLAAMAGVSLEAGSGGTRGAVVERPATPRRDSTGANGAGEIARAVRSTRRVVRQWPFGKGPCLRESLVLGHLLRRRSPSLQIGIANRSDGLRAHAWLTVDGQVLGESRGFRTFGPLPGASP